VWQSKSAITIMSMRLALARSMVPKVEDEPDEKPTSTATQRPESFEVNARESASKQPQGAPPVAVVGRAA
jgi:hypothetical protein